MQLNKPYTTAKNRGGPIIYIEYSKNTQEKPKKQEQMEKTRGKPKKHKTSRKPKKRGKQKKKLKNLEQPPKKNNKQLEKTKKHGLETLCNTTHVERVSRPCFFGFLEVVWALFGFLEFLLGRFSPVFLFFLFSQDVSSAVRSSATDIADP